MSGVAYYNEIEPETAEWLRELIRMGEIPPGDVDERSIEDVRPDELVGYTQCHFFAGIGGWPLALRLAGWPDDRSVWTASLPCQPFSAAGKRRGTADERHLWPAFWWLVAQRRPAKIRGEQVASRAGRDWLAGVRADLETLGYGVGAADLCAAGVGAPQIRQRLFWMAESECGDRAQKCPVGGRRSKRSETERMDKRFISDRPRRRMGDTEQPGLEGHSGHEIDRNEPGREPANEDRPTAETGGDCGLGDTRLPESSRSVCTEENINRKRSSGSGSLEGPEPAPHGRDSDCGLSDADGRNASTEGIQRGREHRQRAPDGAHFWQEARWTQCADGKSRRIKPGIEPLVDGLPRGVVPRGHIGLADVENSPEARAMRLKGYGNAIVPCLAAVFIQATIEAREHDQNRL